MAIKRIIITIDEKIVAKIRNLQAKLMTQTSKNWHFSSTTNFLIKEGMKSFSKSKQKP